MDKRFALIPPATPNLVNPTAQAAIGRRRSNSGQSNAQWFQVLGIEVGAAGHAENSEEAWNGLG